MQTGDSEYKVNDRRRRHVPNVTPLPWLVFMASPNQIPITQTEQSSHSKCSPNNLQRANPQLNPQYIYHNQRSNVTPLHWLVFMASPQNPTRTTNVPQPKPIVGKKWFCLREPVSEFSGVFFRIFRSIFPNSASVFFRSLSNFPNCFLF